MTWACRYGCHHSLTESWPLRQICRVSVVGSRRPGLAAVAAKEARVRASYDRWWRNCKSIIRGEGCLSATMCSSLGLMITTSPGSPVSSSI